MNLSKETLALIRNFSTINGSIMLKAGNVLSTISEGKNVMAQTTIQETLPCDFGIYDLGEFLGAVSIFQKTELDFKEKYVTISDGGKARIKYFAAGEGIVKAAPTTIKFPQPDVSFELNTAALEMIRKTSSTLKANDVTIAGVDGVLKVIVWDKKNSTSNAYEVEIGTSTENFKANLKVENLKMMPGDYTVEISSKKISRFKSTSADLVYYIAVESDSEF